MLSLTDCTVSGNTADDNGGGLYVSRGATATLTNTIVARNGGGDVQGALDPRSANNLVGIASGMTGISEGSQGNQVGTAQAPIDPLLAPLGDSGGLTPWHGTASGQCGHRRRDVRGRHPDGRPARPAADGARRPRRPCPSIPWG
jgi:parallel beta-helix repeat protein